MVDRAEGTRSAEPADAGSVKLLRRHAAFLHNNFAELPLRVAVLVHPWTLSMRAPLAIDAATGKRGLVAA